jgi:hypothetical protein
MLTGKHPTGTKGMTIANLAEDWRRAREALVDQLALMERDPIFPDANLSPDGRDRIADHLRNAISEYDALLAEYPDA